MSAAPTSRPRWTPRADITLTGRGLGSIMGVEGGSRIEGQHNLAADKRRIAREQPKPFDAIPRGTCTRRGTVGDHANDGVGIDALRDRLARWE